MSVTRRHCAPLQRRATLAPAAALLALTLPSGSAVAAPQGASRADDEAVPAPLPFPDPEHGLSPSPFASAFADLEPPSPVTGPAPGAVDLARIEPPRGPLIVRSLGTRIASYYGKRFHGRLTANGERFDMNAMTAAHKTLPFGTRVRVTNRANGRSVTVRINDRGPFIRGREIDLSRGAAEKIGMIRAGHARVQLDIVSP
ncbi:MAG: septal ring lytic transglycosylase RlpA family protein [Pseudomonadota bacterium]